MKTKLRQRFSRFLLWTPANILQLSVMSRINSWELFNKFQRQEQFTQLKVVLVGVVGFATILGATSIPLQTITEYKLTSAAYIVRYYSLVLAVGHVLLVALAILGEWLPRLVVFRRPYIFATTSYMAIVPLMSCFVFARNTFNARLYLTTVSLMFIVATVYFQESFPVSLFIWLTIIINSIIHLANHSEIEQVSHHNNIIHTCLFPFITISTHYVITLFHAYMQNIATSLMMMSVLTICIIVHILTNIQKKVAFHKIEKSVSTHLDVNKENTKQVSSLSWPNHTCRPCKLQLWTAKGIRIVISKVGEPT